MNGKIIKERYIKTTSPVKLNGYNKVIKKKKKYCLIVSKQKAFNIFYEN